MSEYTMVRDEYAQVRCKEALEKEILNALYSVNSVGLVDVWHDVNEGWCATLDGDFSVKELRIVSDILEKHNNANGK